MRRSQRSLTRSLCCCGLTTLVLAACCKSPFAANAPPPSLLLRAKYRGIRDSTLTIADRGLWPDSAARASFSRGLVLRKNTSTTSARPRRFARDGPLQVTAFLAKDQVALSLVHAAREQVFAPFCASLLDAIGAPSARAAVAENIHWPRDDSAHIVVTVFSEHPSLLEPDQRASWRSVTPAQTDALGSHLEKDVFGDAIAPSLVLDAYVLTPDGSMILGFIEAAEAEGAAGGGSSSLGALRSRIGAAGVAVLGELNSRPKALIHVTVGRLLVWPSEELDASSRARVNRVVATWTHALASGSLPGGAGGALPGVGQRIELKQMELCRDVRWMMGERETLRRFRLRDR